MMTVANAMPCRGVEWDPSALPCGRAAVALILLTVLVSSGCAASRSRHYRSHLSATVAATEPGSQDHTLAAAFGLLGEGETAIASADNGAAWSDDR